jgi:RNA polymerase-associated protein LEO1
LEDGTMGLAGPESTEPTVRLSVENIIRWRSVRDASGQVTGQESNARLVRYSDGSQFLFLGGESFQVTEASVRAPRNHLFQTLHGVEGVKKSVGQISASLKFRVQNVALSKSHARLKEAIAMRHVQISKIKRRYDMDSTQDRLLTEKHMLQLEKDDELKRRKRERAQQKSDRSRRGGGRDVDRKSREGGQLSVGFLEGEEDDEDDEDAGLDEDGSEGEAEFDASAASSKRGHKRRVDEDEDELRLERAKGEEEDDAGSSKKKRGGRKSGKDEPSAAAAADDGEEEVVIKRGSKAKRRKVDDEESEDE